MPNFLISHEKVVLCLHFLPFLLSVSLALQIAHLWYIMDMDLLQDDARLSCPLTICQNSDLFPCCHSGSLYSLFLLSTPVSK